MEWAEMGERGCTPVAEFIEICFSYDDRSGCAQALYQGRIRLRHPLRQNLRSPGGKHSGHLKHVFDTYGNTVQGPTVVPTGYFLICFLCFHERLVVKNGDEGIELIF